MAFDGTSSSEDFWRQNIYGGWASLVALLLIFLWHSYRTFSPRFFAPSSSLASPSTLTASSGSPATRFGVSEILSNADLKFLMVKLDGKASGSEKWDNVIDKSNNLVSYSAKCCKPKDAPLAYLSVTLFENCSTETLRDFYMDNEYRKQWDKTVVDHVQLHVDQNNGVEFGQTVKKFPLLTAREYVLAWRLWEGKDKTFYCFIKDCEHPSAPKLNKYVRVSYFRSGWRIRKVPGRNACEIKMYHQENAGLNVDMAKLAFKKGIWSFICKMDNALRKYPTLRLPSQSANAVTLIKMVPDELDMVNDAASQSTSGTSAVSGEVTSPQKKLSRRPSKKMVANGLLLAGGLFCLTRGHSSLGSKVAMAYIVNKLYKRGASSATGGNQNIGT